MNMFHLMVLVSMTGSVAGGAGPSLDRPMELPGSSTAAVRASAVRALGEARATEAVPALIGALKDPDTNVRFYAAHALGEIKAPAAAPALMDALLDREGPVREQAAWALRELRDSSLARPLAASLAGPDADVRSIAWLLGELARDETPELIAPMLASPDAAVRLRCVTALGLLDSDAARMSIRMLLAGETDAAVRSAAESFFPPPPPLPSPSAWWSFDDGDTETARDQTGRGNNGEIRGCEVVAGRRGKALRFGEGRYIELGRPPALSTANRPFTVMAWIQTVADRGVVVARGGAANGYSLYLLDGAPRFGIRRSQDEPPVIVRGDAAIGDGWTHLAGVVRDDRLELVVNGVKVAETASPGFLKGDGGQGMEIGFDVSNSACEITDALSGVIDEVMVFDSALSAEQIADWAEGKNP